MTLLNAYLLIVATGASAVILVVVVVLVFIEPQFENSGSGNSSQLTHGLIESLDECYADIRQVANYRLG